MREKDAIYSFIHSVHRHKEYHFQMIHELELELEQEQDIQRHL